MGTVAKTLSLLNHLSAESPEMGLTDFLRASGYDKATTHRRLRELAEAGFLEQDPVRRTYRLGPAVARLALVREQTVPEEATVRRLLEDLNAELRETVHVSLVQGLSGLSTLAHEDDKSHAVRVHIDPAALLPYHATASGLVVLAFSEREFVDRVLERALTRPTDRSETDPARLRAALDDIRRTGFGVSEGWYEAGVTGLSAPIFDRNGSCCGAVATAGPADRMSRDRRQDMQAALARTARRLTESRGGQIPPSLARAWEGAD